MNKRITQEDAENMTREILDKKMCDNCVRIPGAIDYPKREDCECTCHKPKECNSSAHKIYKVACHEFWGCAWTSWYCPVKNCNTIVYNTNMGARIDIGKHLEVHNLKEL